MAADPDVLIDCAIRQITGKEIRDYVGSDDTNVSTRGAFTFCPDPAGVDRNAVDIEHVIRSHPADLRRFDLLIATLGGLY